MSISKYETIVQVIRHWARETPDTTAFRFLTDFGDCAKDLTYQGLDAEARALALSLSESARPGDRAIMIFSSEHAFVRAYFGCLYAGLIPVPAPPPMPGRAMRRFSTLFEDCEPAMALTDAGIMARGRQLVEATGGVRWIDVEEEHGADPDDWKAGDLRGDRTALLQYTSGSTSSPKGVMISHRALIDDTIAVGRCFGFEGRTVRMAAWLPLYHDMGLIGHVINPSCLGVTSILMPTMDFLQRPASWLKAISDHGATFSVAPNFAYDLCVERVSASQKEEIDLSSWIWAANGSEPVRLATMERFARSFAACGFEREMFFPCYGLAEGLFISTGPIEGEPVFCRAQRAALEDDRIIEVGKEDESAVVFVSCGPVRDDCSVEIVDPDSRELRREMEVGEIWMTGAGVTDGYWNKPEETEAVFHAACKGGDEHHLRTGDLGFMKDGHLYICGRTKDLIIINGKNHHPQDLELTVGGCHQALRPGACAAFSVDLEDREGLVLVCEVRRSAMRDLDPEIIIGAIAEAVSNEHGVGLHEGVLIAPGSLPKTTSGKVMRGSCRRAYLDGELTTLKGNQDE